MHEYILIHLFRFPFHKNLELQFCDSSYGLKDMYLSAPQLLNFELIQIYRCNQLLQTLKTGIFFPHVP